MPKKYDVKLVYLTDSKEVHAWWKQYLPNADGRLWTLYVPPGHPLSPFNGSTRAREGLIELGVIHA